VNGRAQQAVIDLQSPVFGLAGFDQAHQSNIEQATDVRRRVHQNMMSIGSPSSRSELGYEAEIKGKHHSFRKEATQFEEFGVTVVVNLLRNYVASR
jgi:hypothetical protein